MKIPDTNWLVVATASALLLSPDALLGALTWETSARVIGESAPATNCFRIWIDGQKAVQSAVCEKVGSLRDAQRTPLFDNLPFLKLRAGDNFVKGRSWSKLAKLSGFSKEDYYFVFSSGKYYDLLGAWDEGKNRYLAYSGHFSLLFDWDVTLENATALKNIRASSCPAVSAKGYASLKAAIRPKFPGSIRTEEEIELSPPHFEGEGIARARVAAGRGTFTSLWVLSSASTCGHTRASKGVKFHARKFPNRR